MAVVSLAASVWQVSIDSPRAGSAAARGGRLAAVCAQPYLSEHEDAEETKRLVEGAGKTVSANRSAVY